MAGAMRCSSFPVFGKSTPLSNTAKTYHIFPTLGKPEIAEPAQTLPISLETALSNAFCSSSTNVKASAARADMAWKSRPAGAPRCVFRAIASERIHLLELVQMLFDVVIRVPERHPAGDKFQRPVGREIRPA